VTTDIDAFLAEQMGWHKHYIYNRSKDDLRSVGWCECSHPTENGEAHYIMQAGLNSPSPLFQITDYMRIGKASNWSPSTRWDHIGLVIEWMEKEKGKFETEVHGVAAGMMVRKSWFGTPETNFQLLVDEQVFLTPAHIALAAAKALGWKEVEA
jgi:hypothetical protein